ncbi:alpha/beta fold hydrolase [Amycolatopsis panacis]|nr:alpha/beta hydrolase [Amycolatopsis panacis]
MSTRDQPELPDPVRMRTNGIELSVHLAGAGPVVVLAHGFPDLAYSWRHQVPALVAAGYRVVVPDMRGYGASDRPAAVAGYDAETVGADLIGLLDVLGVDRAAFIGHDWGANSVWPLAFTRPDRVRGIAGLSVPYLPAAPVSPLDILRNRLGEDFYMVRFQPVGPPEDRLAKDVRATLLAILSDRDPFAEVDSSVLPPWLSPQELSRYTAAFERTGFGAGLNYYRNMERNWAAAAGRSGTTTAVPALFATGDRDAVAAFMPSARMSEVFLDLRTTTVAGAGHWVHQQAPDVVNPLLLEFLGGLPQ